MLAFEAELAHLPALTSELMDPGLEYIGILEMLVNTPTVEYCSGVSFCLSSAWLGLLKVMAFHPVN